MELIRCENGHYFDLNKYTSCPYCRKKENETSLLQQKLSQVPAFKITAGNLNEAVTEAKPVHRLSCGTDEGTGFAASAGQDSVTVGYFSSRSGTAYVTGWIVCTDGPQKGRDYRIGHGINWVGRRPDMDIYIREDPDIAAERHCALVYDGRGNRFYLLNGKGNTYLNGNILEQSELLKAGDVIEIGRSTFEFIPFCREGRTWE